MTDFEEPLRIDLDEKQVAFSERLCDSFWKNIEIMSSNADRIEHRRYLRIWAIYLGILALEDFESVIILAKSNKQRSIMTLLRDIIGYHFRLRYYAIQGLPIIEGWNKSAGLDTSRFEEQVFAIRDMKNQKIKSAKLLRFWAEKSENEELQKEINLIYLENSKTYEQCIGNMADYLKEKAPNEDEIENLIWLHNTWKWEACFSHADQVTMNFAIQFDENNHRIYRNSPTARYPTCVAEACFVMTEILKTFGMIDPFVYDLCALKFESAKAFHGGMG